MKRPLCLLTLAAAMLVSPAFAKTVTLTREFIAANVPRAARAIPAIRSLMKDPASFVLEGVYLKAPNKEGISDVCFAFRSHNSYGGYSGSGTARLNSKDIVDNVYDSDMAASVFNPCLLTSESNWVNITAEVTAALTQPPAAKPLTRGDRAAWVTNFNDGMRKQNVAGYAEITGDVLTVHSERTSSVRFHAALVNNALMDSLKQMEIATLIYTNDADLKFTYDLVHNTEVK
jgi:hypothetical protein